MLRYAVAALGLVLSSVVPAFAQQDVPAPTPLFPGAGKSGVQTEELPPSSAAPSSTTVTISPGPGTASGSPPSTATSGPPPAGSSPSGSAPAATLTPAPLPSATAASSEQTGRIFCDQQVAVKVAERASAPEAFRQFLGIWSDANWTAQLCAALIVQSVKPDGTASIVYAYGPMVRGRGQGGVLYGEGIIQPDGWLRFQNVDGSQFAFHPVYADLDGRLTTPQGQNYKAVFKKTP